MNLPSIFRPRLLPSERSRDILQLPREDGRKRTRLAPILIGGSRLRFLSFHVGRRNERRSLHPLAGLPSSRDYWFGKVPVALFSVITLALFSVIAFFANMAQWPCFWLSTGPLFGYHLHLSSRVTKSNSPALLLTVCAGLRPR
jgi:hypothetical protein